MYNLYKITIKEHKNYAKYISQCKMKHIFDTIINILNIKIINFISVT